MKNMTKTIRKLINERLSLVHPKKLFTNSSAFPIPIKSIAEPAYENMVNNSILSITLFDR